MEYPKYRRRKIIVDPQFQSRLILKISIYVLIAVVFFLLLMGALYYRHGESETKIIQPTPFFLTEEESVFEELPHLIEILWPIILAYLIGMVLFTYFFGFILSLRMSGPHFRLKRYLKEMKKGDLNREIRLRSKDTLFHPFADEINDLRLNIQSSINEMKDICKEINSYVDDKQKQHLDRLNEILSRFKT